VATQQSTQALHVIIIGAGTGGLCLAHGLKRAGISVAVYERDRTRADGLQGYRVGIDPDGSRALHQCLPPELYDTFVATCARTPKFFNMLTENLAEVLSLDITRPNEDAVNSEKSVSRMTMRQVLLTGLEDIVHFDKTFVRYEQTPDGKVTAFFEDGASATGDVLVAADGSNSRVRGQYLPQAKMEDTGIIAIAGKVPLTPESKALVSDKVFYGITVIFAPKGYFSILHVMEFKWDRNGVKRGIGGNDADLLARWPGLLFDNTTDHIIWGFSAAHQRFAQDPMQMRGEELVRLTLDMTKNWHPNLRKLMSMTDPSTCFPLNIRTSVPLEAWPTTNITLLGDAIHTMTPGRGVGANTALRDAALICRNLIAVRDGQKPLLQAIHEYEAEMIEYGFDAVIKSREQNDARDAIHRPVIGRIMLALMRTGMRLVNALPPLKRRMADNMLRYRGADREFAHANPSPTR
jgi:2-polyprenyl-6-methoxyphenol hydroxylase-like FAD-dependent oxidoreductase